jgi:hypothetical protein
MRYDVDTSDSFGYVSWKTCLRLRDYTIAGQEKPMIAERKTWKRVTYTTRDGTWDESQPVHGLCITEFGRCYYEENWQRYRELYSEVNAPAPQPIVRSEEL